MTRRGAERLAIFAIAWGVVLAPGFAVFAVLQALSCGWLE